MDPWVIIAGLAMLALVFAAGGYVLGYEEGRRDERTHRRSNGR